MLFNLTRPLRGQVFFLVKFQFSVAVDYNIWPLHGNQFPSLDFTNVWNGIQISYSSHYVCVHTCQSKPFVVHNKVPCILIVRSSDRSEGEVWVNAREWEAAISQPAKQEGVWVQQFPGCVEILWGCPAPEVWTDGFGGAHRKVLGESVVLMFTASWLNHWGGLLKRKYVCVSLCVGDVKSKMVLFCFPPSSVCHVLAVEQQATIIKKQLWSVWLSASVKVPPANKMSSNPNWESDIEPVIVKRGGMWIPHRVIMHPSFIQS